MSWVSAIGEFKGIHPAVNPQNDSGVLLLAGAGSSCCRFQAERYQAYCQIRPKPDQPE
jgi:hypothetical protein